MGSDESHCNVSLTVRDSVHKSQPFWRERTAEADSNRGPSTHQPNALPLGQTGSHRGDEKPCKQFPTLSRVLRYSSVVRAPDSRLKGRGFESWQERRENFLLKGQIYVLFFRCPFHPRVTAVERKRSRSFCQRCMWQVTAKHACTLRMWLCVKWHGAWLYGVHRTRRDGSSFMWYQPCQRYKYTTSVDTQKRAIKT